MLNTLRGPHAKKILWVLAIVIIIAFGLSGAGFYLAGRGRGTLGTINNRKITPGMYSEYIQLAQIFLLTHTPPDSKKITTRDMQNLAQDFMVLLWKAKKDNISVSDQEVVNYVKLRFFGENEFDQETYERYLEFLTKRYNLAITTRSFEEAVRDFIKIDKLFEKYIDSSISEEEVKKLYERDNQKARINYLAIPYDKFKVEADIELSEIEQFYKDNEVLFRREPQVNIKYTIITSDNDSLQEIQEKIAKKITINELADKFALDVKETGFIGANDPIKEIGWQTQINQIAFALEKDMLIPIEVGDNVILLTKQDEKQAYTPALDEIKEEVKEKLVMEKAKIDAKNYSQEILGEITENKVTDLRRLSKKDKVDFKETDYFKYYDYIEGIGLDEKISEIVFALAIDQIHSEPILVENAVVIIQLKELPPVNEEDFAEKRQIYANSLKKNKELIGRLRLLTRLREDSNFTFTLPTTTQQ